MNHQQQSALRARSVGGASRVELLGVTINVTLSSADTAGAFALIDSVTPPHREGTHAHWHAHTTEWVYVIDGTLACTIGDATITATPGTAIVVPPTTVHTFWNPTAAPVRFLSLFAPGGCEGYFAEVAALIAARGRWPPLDPAESLALAARHDTLLLNQSP